MSSTQLLIGDVFRNGARAVPDRVAAALGDECLTFAEVDRLANQIGRVLRDRGVACGDRVAVYSGTDLRLVPVFAALAKIGAVLAPVSGALTEDEAAPVIDLARPALTIRGADLGALLDDAATRDAGDIDEPALRETDPHVVFFTSGSTGTPKGVVLSHRVNHLRSHPGALLEPRGAMVCPYPLFHMGAWTIALQQWQARDRVVFVHRADADEIGEAVARHRAVRMNCIPGVWRRLLEAGVDLRSIRLADTGTSATPPELLDAMRAAIPGASVRVFYGSTEAGSVASLAPDEIDRKPGSVGVPAPLAEVRLSDEGEVQVRGPLLFDGYFDNADATAAAFTDDGWYRTGDLADVDADGYLTIVGRAGDLIRTGGEGVAPVEVETVLAGHPDLRDVAVIGVPDPQWGEVVCAVVVAVGEVTLDDLRAHCDGRLAGFKVPRRLEIVDAIPRTPATNQVQRRLLVERFS